MNHPVRACLLRAKRANAECRIRHKLSQPFHPSPSFNPQAQAIMVDNMEEASRSGTRISYPRLGMRIHTGGSIQLK